MHENVAPADIDSDTTSLYSTVVQLSNAAYYFVLNLTIILE